jgi:hypothetical protein
MPRMQVLFVVLNEDRESARSNAERAETGVKAAHRRHILGEHGRLAVDPNDQAVSALQQQLARGLAVRLPRYRVQVQPRREARDKAKVERQVVEVHGGVALRTNLREIAWQIERHLIVDPLQVRCLARPRWAEGHDPAGQLFPLGVRRGHGRLRNAWWVRWHERRQSQRRPRDDLAKPEPRWSTPPRDNASRHGVTGRSVITPHMVLPSVHAESSSKAAPSTRSVSGP